VADIYTPTSHSDGELLDKDDLNNLENGLGTATTQLDQVSDQVTALVAGGGSSRQALSGTFPPQESPAIGLPFFATNLTPPRVVWGTGTSWVNSDGTAINDSPGGGGGGTPRRHRTCGPQSPLAAPSVRSSWPGMPCPARPATSSTRPSPRTA
jgi:hypothetical protein